MRFLFIALLTGLTGCSTPSSHTVVKANWVRSDLSIGEYLQAENSRSLLTFVRDGPPSTRGLVRVFTDQPTIEVLDPNAADGKDLHRSNSWIVYRKNSQGLVLIDQKPIAFSDFIEKIRAVYASDDQIKVFVDTPDHKSALIVLDSHGEIIRQTPLPDSPRAVFVFGEKTRLLSQSPSGLYLSTLNDKTDALSEVTLIEAGDCGSYVAVDTVGSQLWIAYLDQENGLLRLATRDANDSTFRLETVDGTPNKTMRGMDIVFFRDESLGKDLRGLAYLDAWALKLRIARLKNGQWRSEQIQIRGSLGFYSQVLETSPQKLKLAFHSFRTESESLDPTFEDLGIVDIGLK